MPDEYKIHVFFMKETLSIEDLHVTSSMTLPTVAAIFGGIFCAARDVLMEIALENGRK
jgi:hypothetical protein